MSDRQDFDEAEDGDVGTSTGEATSTQTKPNRQPNWQDDPEYRRQQSERDKAEAQARREAYELRQRLVQVEQTMHQTNMQGLDTEGQLAYQNRLYQQQLAELQRERDLQAYAQQVKSDIDDIVKRTGIQRYKLEEAMERPGFSVHSAWQMGWDHKEAEDAKKGRPESREEEIERTADDRVDIGVPKGPKSKAGKLLEEWRVARKNYNQRDQVRIMAQADREGVELPED